MSECKCDLRTKLVGDGCRYCNPQDYIDHLHDALEQKDAWVDLTNKEVDTIRANALTKEWAILMAQSTLREKNSA